jgi:DNA-directed RNA polymerase subunit RPC12/RpoP
LDLEEITQVEIDMLHVRHFYSLEIRSWMQWMESNFKDKNQLELFFSNIRLSIIQTQNYISGFVPLAYRIQSLIVLYYCESCDEEIEVTLQSEDYRSADKKRSQVLEEIRQVPCRTCSEKAMAEFRPEDVVNLLLDVQNQQSE